MKKAALVLVVVLAAFAVRVFSLPLTTEKEEPGLRVVRGAVHVHSNLSHDSTQTVAMIAADAKAAGLDLVVVTDHNKMIDAPSYTDGVLVVPGMEESRDEGHVLGIGDLHAAAHPDSRKHPMNDAAVLGTQGYEVLSASSDFYEMLRGPQILWALAYPLRPTVALAAMYPARARGLDRYDRFSKDRVLRLLCGVDDHGRVGAVERLQTYVTYFPTFIPMRDAKEDATVARDLLASGETFCALGLYGDASPLSVSIASDAVPIASVGGEHRLPVNVRVRWATPLPPGHKIYLLKDGEELVSTRESRLEKALTAPGTYRIELGRDVPTLFGTRHIRWIYTNPIYVVPGVV